MLNNEDADMDSNFNDHHLQHSSDRNTGELLCKHRQKKKPWFIAEILDVCDRRTKLRKKRFKPEGSEKYKEVNNNIKRCINSKKENWIVEQCSESEEN